MAGNKSIDDCVLQSEVADMMEEIKTMFKDHSNVMNHTLESINRRVSTLIERMDGFEKRLPTARVGDASINNDDNNNCGGASDEEDDMNGGCRSSIRRGNYRFGGDVTQNDPASNQHDLNPAITAPLLL
jgi:hypothetical protein